MKTIKETFVFESKEAFEKAIFNEMREDVPAMFNGVSKEFAKDHPNYETNNETNAYCWNCLDCVNSIGCDSCTDCVWCRRCESCDSCVQCENCKDTRYSVWCENINNSLNCHFVQFHEFHEVGFKNRMDQQLFVSYNKYGKKEYFIPEDNDKN
jgi:hypothetical protein